MGCSRNRKSRIALCILSLAPFVFPYKAQAGLYFSKESYRPLPAKWTGYLADRRLILFAMKPEGRVLPIPPYAEQIKKLAEQQLSDDGAADLAALFIRTGEPRKAVDLLEPRLRKSPDHFRMHANLASAWHTLGEWRKAEAELEESIRTAPESAKSIERLHQKWVQLRSTEEGKVSDANAASPDKLFGDFPLTQKNLPENALGDVQLLALWFPEDGRLLWLLAELAAAHGDIRTAANLLDGCVTERHMGSRDVRERRQSLRSQVDEADKESRTIPHSIRFRSNRILVSGIDPAKLPEVKADGVNTLYWAELGEAEHGPKGKLQLPERLAKLDGKKVKLVGYPANRKGETGTLLAEQPIGCWFCEAPALNQLLWIEIRDGKLTVGEPNQVVGLFRINRDDPEALPFRLEEASVGKPE